MNNKLHFRVVKAATLALALLGLAPAGMAPGTATAQVSSAELFQPVVTINGKVVTNYELQQRILMMKVFRTPGNVEDDALDALVDDRLRAIAAQRMDIALTEEQIETGETEFAGRANLDREGLIKALAGAGVSRETFRDFVSAGLLWREVVRQRFAGRVQISDDEVDRALALTSRTGGASALFSEIIIPADNPDRAAQAQRIVADIVANVRTETAFSSYARRYSASPSKRTGGRLPEPVPLGNLPGPIAQSLLTLPPGGVTPPFPIPNAIAIFQLRRLIETDSPAVEAVEVEYAQFLIPGGQSEEALREAGKVKARVDSCNDLYKVAQGLPEERLVRETKTTDALPQDIALALARLDADESTTLVRGNALVFLMLCNRTVALGDEEVNRSGIRDRLVNQRIAGYANSYLAELKADAIITYP